MASQMQFHGLPEWKALLESYNIHLIVTYSIDEFTGQLVPLIPALLHDKDWHLLYVDTNSLIFLRSDPENMEILKRFELPGEQVWDEVISEASIRSQMLSNNVNLYITLGDAYFAKKDYLTAVAVYLIAKRIDPLNRVANERLTLLKTFIH
jgi:hypothetical protein